jgi:predicted GTPase
MAIDKRRTRELIDGVQASFDGLTRDLPMPARDWLRQRVLGAAIGEIKALIEESRPPVFYLLGRSGHGKSSLLNALAGREVAEVGHVRPQTPGADPYFVGFQEVFAEWQVVDSRGIFETPMGEGGGIDPVEQAKADIRKYRPDVILHVIAASEARALSNDFRVFAEIQRTVTKDLGAAIPTVMVLTKVDLLGDPAAWPPAGEPEKAAQVKDVLDYVAEVLGARPQRINLNSTLDGYTLAAREYVGIEPIMRAGLRSVGSPLCACA